MIQGSSRPKVKYSQILAGKVPEIWEWNNRQGCKQVISLEFVNIFTSDGRQPCKNVLSVLLSSGHGELETGLLIAGPSVEVLWVVCSALHIDFRLLDPLANVDYTCQI